MSGNHLDKISEIGIIPALVEKRWLATVIMICKLGLVQGRAEVLWCPGPGATAWLYAGTDLRIGNGLGPRALSYDDSILTKNLRNCAEAELHNLPWNERKCKCLL